MRRSHLMLHTVTSDGVCSSLLEALALGLPVVAAENGSRPMSTLTYPPADSGAMSQRIIDVLKHQNEHRRRIMKPVLQDTVTQEAELLIAAASASRGTPAFSPPTAPAVSSVQEKAGITCHDR